MAIGNNEARLAWIEKLVEAGFEISTLISPQAFISPCKTGFDTLGIRKHNRDHEILKQSLNTIVWHTLFFHQNIRGKFNEFRVG